MDVIRRPILFLSMLPSISTSEFISLSKGFSPGADGTLQPMESLDPGFFGFLILQVRVLILIRPEPGMPGNPGRLFQSLGQTGGGFSPASQDVADGRPRAVGLLGNPGLFTMFKFHKSDISTWFYHVKKYLTKNT